MGLVGKGVVGFSFGFLGPSASELSGEFESIQRQCLLKVPFWQRSEARFPHDELKIRRLSDVSKLREFPCRCGQVGADFDAQPSPCETLEGPQKGGARTDHCSGHSGPMSYREGTETS
jgi:hypothetical protein